MLDRESRKYKNLTLISVGITIFGFIAALIANVGFSKGLIAFCLATAFCVASEICQICFAINARITPDEDDTYTDRIQAANTGVIKTAVAITFINVLSFAFCLPLVTMINGASYGLVFEYWLGYGLIFSAIAFVIGYIIYTLFVRKALADKGIITLAEKRAEEIKKNNKLLIKVVSISTVIALVLGVCIVVWNTVGWDISVKELTFDNCDDFKAFMESEYDAWYEEGYSHVDENGDIVVEGFIGGYPQRVYEKIYDQNGRVICEYYYNPDLYTAIRFTESSNDKMPVTVITNQARYDAGYTVQTVESMLYALIAVDFISAAGVYLVKSKKNKKTA